jgi:hypothetical protein
MVLHSAKTHGIDRTLLYKDEELKTEDVSAI